MLEIELCTISTDIDVNNICQPVYYFHYIFGTEPRILKDKRASNDTTPNTIRFATPAQSYLFYTIVLQSPEKTHTGGRYSGFLDSGSCLQCTPPPFSLSPLLPFPRFVATLATLCSGLWARQNQLLSRNARWRRKRESSIIFPFDISDIPFGSSNHDN